MGWFLIIIAIVMLVVSVVSNFYILVYFSSEEDKNSAYFPKFLVVLGLTMAELLVLLLPLDVANKTDQLLDMKILWLIFFVVIAALVIVVFPFAIFYYEEDDESVGRQCAAAVKYTIVTTFLAVLVIVLSYAFLNEAQVPILQMKSPLFPASAVGTAFTATSERCVEQTGLCTEADSILKMSMSFPVYLIGLIALLGWLFFAIFGGIGMVALPLDLLRAWYFRPRPLDLQQWAREKILLRDRATALIEIGKKIEKDYMGRRDRKYKKVYNKFRAAVYHLENDFSKLRTAYKEKGGSPIKYWSIGILGFFAAIISLCWFLHIILFMAIDPPVSPFINDILKASESEFSLFGTILYCAFSMYLIWAVIKGNMKFGLRLLVIPIHPMRVGQTMMNSFLVNTSLILLSSVACVQFCSRAFAQYARLTDAAIIFGQQVTKMKGVHYLFDFFQYAFLGIMGLTALYLICFPKDLSKEHELQDDYEALQGRGHTKDKSLQKKRWFG